MHIQLNGHRTKLNIKTGINVHLVSYITPTRFAAPSSREQYITISLNSQTWACLDKKTGSVYNGNDRKHTIGYLIASGEFAEIDRDDTKYKWVDM